MRRSQLANQAFIYIMAGIIFSLVLIFGYKAIDSLNQDARDVELVNLRKDIQSNIRDVASSQDQAKKEFSIPRGFDQICFVDQSKGGSTCQDTSSLCYEKCLLNGGDGSIPALICNMWESNVTHNVYLIPLSKIPVSTSRIEVYNHTGGEVGANCVDVSSGNIELRLKGQGDRAEVHPVYG